MAAALIATAIADSVFRIFISTEVYHTTLRNVHSKMI
jgi:hypothetical protein